MEIPGGSSGRDPEAGPTEAGMPGLAERLNELFHTVHRPGSTELWNNETAAWEITRSGLSVSAAYLSQLRTGKRLNPSARHLAALAGMFQVDMKSFFPSSDAPQPATSGTPSRAASRILSLLDDVSAAGVATIEGDIARVREAEDLPVIAPTSPRDAPAEQRPVSAEDRP